MPRLSELTPGQISRIVHLDPESPFFLRLQALGFVPGTLVQVRRGAPFGDPIEYELRGSRFCLRRRDAQTIVVALEERATSPGLVPQPKTPALG